MINQRPTYNQNKHKNIVSTHIKSYTPKSSVKHMFDKRLANQNMPYKQQVPSYSSRSIEEKNTYKSSI